MADDRVLLTYEQAVARLPDAQRIHTFRSSPLALLGANWERPALLDALRSAKTIEEAGPEASAMHHGLVLWDERGPLFIETRKEEENG